MLNIPINDKYKITSDAHNFIINEYHQGKNGGSWKPILFYANFDSLFWGLFNHTIRESCCVSLCELGEQVKEAKRQIDTLRAAVLSTPPKPVLTDGR